MSFHEQISGRNEVEQNLFITNSIQLELVKRMFGDKREDHVLEWIKQNSTKFREVLEQKLATDKNFFSRCQTDLKKVTDEFEEEMGLLHKA